MENIVIAISAVLILCVQAHRNFLIMKQPTVEPQQPVEPTIITVEVPVIDYDKLATAISPVITEYHVAVEPIDYEKLEKAIKDAVPTYIQRQDVIVPVPTIESPTVAPPEPYMIDVNGTQVEVKRFPNR